MSKKPPLILSNELTRSFSRSESIPYKVKKKKKHFNVSLKLMSKENFPMDLRGRFQGQSIPYKIKKKKKLFNVSSKLMSKENFHYGLTSSFSRPESIPYKIKKRNIFNVSLKLMSKENNSQWTYKVVSKARVRSLKKKKKETF